MGFFEAWLRSFVPAGAPTAAEWVCILREAALLHPGRDPEDGLFVRVACDGGALTATAYRHREDA